MQAGKSASEAIAAMQAQAKFHRVSPGSGGDAQGRSAIHSGPNVLGIWGEARAEDVASGGNLLANPSVPQAVVDGFLIKAPATSATG